MSISINNQHVVEALIEALRPLAGLPNICGEDFQGVVTGLLDLGGFLGVCSYHNRMAWNQQVYAKLMSPTSAPPCTSALEAYERCELVAEMVMNTRTRIQRTPNWLLEFAKLKYRLCDIAVFRFKKQ